MKFKKILSGMLAAMMTMTALSANLGAFAEEESDSATDENTLVIHYSKIQKGNVDRKEKAFVDAAYSDSEKGTVVKVSPNTSTTESGSVNIDGYGIEGLKIDVTKFNYLTVEYKFVSDYSGDIKPSINFLPNGGVLIKAGSVTANESLVKNEWSTMTFNIGSVVKPLVAEGKQYIGQIHFNIFGSALPTNMSASDYILINNFTFSVDNPRGDVYYEASFVSGDETATGEAPQPIKARFEDVITLPEIPFKSPLEGRVATGWIPNVGTKIYQPGDEFTMPEKDVIFTPNWKDEFIAEDLVELSFPGYYNGICDHKDTATADAVVMDGYDTIEMTPNTASENGAINMDGWSYGGAQINVEAYGTIAVLYKYVSQNPVSGKANLNIMKSSVFAGATSMTSREDIVANRWAIVSFDLTAARANIAEGYEPIIQQMHYYPLGGHKVNTLDGNDRIYVAKMYAFPAESSSMVIHESFMNGYADGTFGVNGNMTRAEACTIVARLVAGGDENVPADKTTAFTDVDSAEWYYKYVSYVESLGYLKSYSGEFKPNQAITRAEFVELVYNMGLLEDNGKNGTFTDVPADHARATVIAAAGKAGLVNGYDNGDGTFCFKPDNTITRAEVVKVINNAYGKAPSADGIFESAKNTFSDVTPDHWAYADIIDAAVGHIAYIGEAGTEVWITKSGANNIAEDYSPDYETGNAKMEEVQKLIDSRIAEIKATESAKFDISGTTYYVSTQGSDSNDGKSEATPFATATKASNVAKKGDLVLFKRGDEWRERWSAKYGVTYSAYGTGAKPLFNGNTLGDAADENLWTLVDGTTNIWQYKNKVLDVGNIVVNNDEKTIEKVVPVLKGSEHLVNNNVWDPKTSLTNNEHFVCIYDNVTNGEVAVASEMSTLYVRCDEGNPGKVYSTIELCTRGNLIGVPNEVTLDNIAIKYVGSHGVGMGTVQNVKFTNMEIGYIGGSAQYYSKGSMTRFGNGIEVYGGCDGFTIDNCYVYQCYDAGITHQLSSGGTQDYTEQNVYFTNNVIDKCIYNIEYFMGKADSEAVVRLLKNINYTNNILARSGYGWGMSPSRSASIKGWDHNNRSEGFKIENNIFFMDRFNACHLGASMATWMPTFKGNTYIQKYGNQFTKVGANGATQYMFNGKAAENLENKIGEKDFKLYYVSPDIEVK